ncbi:hypothetical protein BKH41_07935 [Helicobacter sp. 12S02232-10]|uniref:J domain-containing protein n=1 Tax=Helicobacter sp. 12S02232-10 TaxID=1476197 RepID=UPI000BA673A0|nr:J domain-containing protein [Helicobacter sp. 12S02232-10]PAF47201.1 hypothetical protein BKH41_07935 [Helicobacter sp. 12S02232-10]
MSVSYCNRYVQIELFQGSRLLEKVLEYANKHFSEQHHLSSSLLILDDGERFKKDYLINWTYHASLQEGKNDLETLLLQSHLPIRIKILKKNNILQKIKISMRVIGLNKVILELNSQNRVAKRYLKTLFREYLVLETEDEIHLSGFETHFWENVMDLISSKIIHNVAIDFDYKGFQSETFGSSSFLTQDERLLRQCYFELESRFDDDFMSVKKRYLRLVKTYHPDNVYGKDESIIRTYHDRFRKINEAYQAIKKVCANAS